MGANSAVVDTSAAVATAPRRRWLTALLVLVAAGPLGWGAHSILTDGLFIDLGVYRMGGQALVEGQPLYDASYPIASLPFTYTPFAATVFVPFALLPWVASIVVWTLLSLAAFARVCWLVARPVAHRLPVRVQPYQLALLLFSVGLWFEPVLATLSFGQVNLVLLWLVLEDLLARPDRRGRGVLLGIATGIKLIPGLFILYLLLVGRRRDAERSMASAAATVAVGFVMQPDQAVRYWTGIAYDPSRVGGVAYISNQSVNGVIIRFSHPGGIKWLWIAAVVPIAAACLWLGRGLWQRGLRLTSVSVVAVGALLVSPVSWSHHYVWFVPMLAAVAEVASLNRAAWYMAIPIVVLAVLRPIWWVPNTGDLEYLHTPVQRLYGNSYTWLTVAFVAFAWWASRLAVAAREPLSGGEQPGPLVEHA